MPNLKPKAQPPDFSGSRTFFLAGFIGGPAYPDPKPSDQCHRNGSAGNWSQKVNPAGGQLAGDDGRHRGAGGNGDQGLDHFTPTLRTSMTSRTMVTSSRVAMMRMRLEDSSWRCRRRVVACPSVSLQFFTLFVDLADPRIERTRVHELFEIVVVALCGTIAFADTWADIERFGNERIDWLRTFLRLEAGIPSHDTFGRVFAMLDPAGLASRLYPAMARRHRP